MGKANPIRSARDAKKLTQSAFASIVGVSAMTVSRWERGENLPRPEHWPKIKEAIGVELRFEMRQKQGVAA